MSHLTRLAADETAGGDLVLLSYSKLFERRVAAFDVRAVPLMLENHGQRRESGDHSN